MKHLLISAVTLSTALIAAPLQAKVNVFTCEPEWKALTEVIGGDKVNVTSATNAFQDPHHIEARPSLIAKTRRADLVICTGSELEIGWLPLLMRQSGNSAIQADKPGYFMASEMVERLGVPEKLDRSMGDIHASGNPHVHLDPYRLLSIAEALALRLETIDSENKDIYRDRLKDFKKEWQTTILEWETKSQALKGKKVIVYHKNWTYLLNWLGIEAIADLEPKPGIPPTSSHLVSLLQVANTEKPAAILIAAYQNDKGAKWLAKKSGVPLLTLPFTVGGNNEADSLEALYQNTLTSLLNTLNRE